VENHGFSFNYCDGQWSTADWLVSLGQEGERTGAGGFGTYTVVVVVVVAG
jgi:hypothetical protein